jgi:peptidoglycan/LPS O-acetylase OafA/YrhL
MRHWAGLDGLRGCAVLAVVLFHMNLTPNGFLGVDVFFVLSGFLITSLILSEYEQCGTVSLARFYLRRSLRLYPALLLVAIFCITVTLITRSAAVHTTLHDAAVSLLYIANFSSPSSGLLDHTWTLSLDEQFYLLWPPLLIYILRRRMPQAAIPSIGILTAILTADLILGQDGPVHTYVRAMGLPLGCYLALNLKHRRRIATLGRLGWAATVTLAALIVLPVPEILLTSWPISPGSLLAAPIVAMLVSRRVRIFETRVIRWFGLRSYGLYLWHFPLLSLARHHAPDFMPVGLRLIVGLLASLMAAELSYSLIEQPIRRLRDRKTKWEIKQITPDILATGSAVRSV